MSFNDTAEEICGRGTSGEGGKEIGGSRGGGTNVGDTDGDGKDEGDTDAEARGERGDEEAFGISVSSKESENEGVNDLCNKEEKV